MVLGISHDRGKARMWSPTSKIWLTYPIVLGDISIAVNYLRVSPQRPNFSIPIWCWWIARETSRVDSWKAGNEETHDPKKLEETHHSAALAGTAGSVEVLKKEGPTMMRC